MDSIALWMHEDVENRQNSMRTARESTDIFSQSEESFIRNFRLSKDAFSYVLSEISGEMEAKRVHGINAQTKLAMALKFFGQGEYQHQIGQDRNISMAQSKDSSSLTEVCTAIEKVLCPKHICFSMTDAEKQRAKHFFMDKTGIPGVIGAVDGTHIQLVRPVSNEHLFFNRKLKHSINAMIICDDQMKIRALNGLYGGSSHDSHIFKVSPERQYLKEMFDNGERSSWLLGDSGYPLEPWLLTPYRIAQANSAEARFNSKLAIGRSIVERIIGVWKARFRCLLAARELHYSPLKAVKIINACGALHNVCLDFKVPQPTPVFEDELGIENPQIMHSGNYRSIAVSLRDEIKRNLR